MSARVFVEWNDNGAQRDSFVVDYSPPDLEGWFADDDGLGEVITAAEDNLSLYLEDLVEEDGVGWRISEGGGADEARALLGAVRQHMRSAGVPGA